LPFVVELRKEPVEFGPVEFLANVRMPHAEEQSAIPLNNRIAADTLFSGRLAERALIRFLRQVIVFLGSHQLGGANEPALPEADEKAVHAARRRLWRKARSPSQILRRNPK
jgi:hypothetical protein